MHSNDINGYALALFSIAIEENKIKIMKSDAEVVIDAISQNEEIEQLLSSKSIIVDKKEQLIDNAFKKINTNIKNFLKIIFIKGFGKHIIPVLKKFISLVNEKNNVKEGLVYTTTPLSMDELRKMEKRVSKSLGFKPVLKNKVDLNLIGGFKVIVDDQTIEDSINSRLEQLKAKLLERRDN